MSISALLSEYPGLVVPRFATPRDPGRRSLGPAVGRAMQALGRPPMPAQRYIADVGGEVDDSGLFAYPLVIVSMQRQAGKTALDLGQSVQRCAGRPRQKVWHTAQTGQAARKKWGELTDDVLASPLKSMVAGKPKRSAGSEALTFINGSILAPHPPTRDGLHGEQSDTNNVDEAWAFDDLQGADLFQAIVPTQATRPGAQTWVWSTAGDRASTWFRGLVERGRAGEPGICLVEFGIPDDADPTDLETIARFHPAYGFTQTMASFRAAQVTLADKPGEFARAYGNRWTGGGERIIREATWLAAQTEDAVPEGRPAYGIAVAEDGSWSAVVAAVADPTGRPWLEVIAHRPGRSWVAPYVLALRDRGQGIAVNRRGPAAPVADALELADVDLLPVTSTDYAAACQDFYDRVTATAEDEAGEIVPVPELIHRRHEGLDDAVDVAGRQKLQDGGWVWSRTKSTGDISTLEAGTLAAWAAARNPAEIPAPFVYFSR